MQQVIEIMSGSLSADHHFSTDPQFGVLMIALPSHHSPAIPKGRTMLCDLTPEDERSPAVRACLAGLSKRWYPVLFRRDRG
jgi:hypothetical protein